jgi:hypothetical protein
MTTTRKTARLAGIAGGGVAALPPWSRPCSHAGYAPGGACGGVRESSLAGGLSGCRVAPEALSRSP